MPLHTSKAECIVAAVNAVAPAPPESIWQDELTAQYITTGGKVLISGDAIVETPLQSNGAFVFEDVAPGSYVVSILNVQGYNPINKLLDIEPGDDAIDFGLVCWQGSACVNVGRTQRL